MESRYFGERLSSAVVQRTLVDDDTLLAVELLLVFLRHPEPGKVKTRLIPAFGAEEAARLYRSMVEQVVATVRSIDRPGLHPRLWVEPATALDEVRRWLGPELSYREQVSGDLGNRIEIAFRSAFAEGAQQVVAIGTDCIELDAELLEQAFTQLRTHDAVIGPALDGGYYLIGLARMLPEVFQGIPWSSTHTAAVTRQRLAELQATVHLLPPLRDIDTPQDLQATNNSRLLT